MVIRCFKLGLVVGLLYSPTLQGSVALEVLYNYSPFSSGRASEQGPYELAPRNRFELEAANWESHYAKALYLLDKTEDRELEESGSLLISAITTINSWLPLAPPKAIIPKFSSSRAEEAFINAVRYHPKPELEPFRAFLHSFRLSQGNIAYVRLLDACPRLLENMDWRYPYLMAKSVYEVSEDWGKAHKYYKMAVDKIPKPHENLDEVLQKYLSASFMRKFYK